MCWRRVLQKDPKAPFFLFSYVDDDVIVARGRGGGLAFWVRSPVVPQPTVPPLLPLTFFSGIAWKHHALVSTTGGTYYFYCYYIIGVDDALVNVSVSHAKGLWFESRRLHSSFSPKSPDSIPVAPGGLSLGWGRRELKPILNYNFCKHHS